jgi:hypothetical protein
VSLGSIHAHKLVAFPKMSLGAYQSWRNGANSTITAFQPSQTVGVVACWVIKSALRIAFPTKLFAVIPTLNMLVGTNA